MPSWFARRLDLEVVSPELATRIATIPDPIPGARLGTSLHSSVDGTRIDASLAAADVSLYRAKHRLTAVPDADALPDAA